MGQACKVYPNSLYTKCPCPEHRARRSKIMKAEAAGVLRKVPPAAAWEALDRMRARGLTVPQIAELAGLNADSLYGAITERKAGHTRRLQSQIRLALVNAERTSRTVRPSWVSPLGASRRLQALAVMGWSGPMLAERTGVPLKTLDNLRVGKGTRVARVHVEAVERVYEELWNVDGGNLIAKGVARKRGWLPPMAWDDDAIDEPEEKSA